MVAANLPYLIAAPVGVGAIVLQRTFRRKKGKRDAEFGVARGVDFKDVRTVINFDVPPSASAYLHRVGRTGRAGRGDYSRKRSLRNEVF